MAIPVTEYNTNVRPTWCVGCGNYAINTAIKKTLSELDIKPNQAFISFDIGCNGNGADKIKVNAFKGLHGRAIPLAIGSHLANRKMTVIADIGDGGTLHEGIEHLIHAVRSNYNITILIHNNENFALTTGQATATTQESKPMYGLPDGKPEREMYISDLVLGQRATFFARAYSGDMLQMIEIFKSAINHKGCSIVEILQYCPTYNKEANPEWFAQKIQKLAQPVQSLEEAIKTSKTEEKINTGVIYQDQSIPTFYDRLQNRKNINTELVEEVKNYDISNLLKYLD
ncbi:MAG: thiamine pyrophosphate-dependent enzyme [Candidatus Dojkabacteria bacterium]|nr:thiamine pyrophosphate-dependent enzyme [Candidatus Dojkabacteria bacterium]